ncbi:MAG: hypothetical protein KKH01_01165 [Firmicutes bacterium]|nr:hypothetical protein [Bacillota bacterium]
MMIEKKTIFSSLGMMTSLVMLYIYNRSLDLHNALLYFLIFFIALFIIFGISIMVKKPKISYIPSIFLVLTSLVFLFLSILNYTHAVERVQMLIFMFESLILSGIGYFAAYLFIVFFIENQPFSILKHIQSYLDYMGLSIGLIVYSIFMIPYLTQGQNEWYVLILILFVNFAITLASGIFVVLIYYFQQKKWKCIQISLGILALYIPISLIIFDMITRSLIYLGLSLWLIIISLSQMIIRNKKDKQNKLLQEEGKAHGQI